MALFRKKPKIVFCENCGEEVKKKHIFHYSSPIGDKHLLCPICYLKYDKKYKKIPPKEIIITDIEKKEYELYIRHLAAGESDKSARLGLNHLKDYEEKLKKIRLIEKNMKNQKINP